MAFDVKRLDIYRKVPKDLTQPTLTGAVISVCCCVFMLVLFLSEFYSFISTEVVSELFVDNAQNSEEKIPVRINISLPSLSCDVVGLDIQDDLGRHEVGFVESTHKRDLPDGGCLFESEFYINKVPGNFHVSTHSASKQPDNIDMRHLIHEVTFGDVIKNEHIERRSFNALAGKEKLTGNSVESHDYVMKVVPTMYEDVWGNVLRSYQYTYAYRSYLSFSHGGKIIPAIWFRYDLSPLTVKYHEKRQPFYNFLTMICAIVGGTFTVAGIIDSCIFTASEIFRKFEIGKLS